MKCQTFLGTNQMAERQRLVSSEGWTVAVPWGPSLLRWGHHCPLLQIRTEEWGWGGGERVCDCDSIPGVYTLYTAPRARSRTLPSDMKPCPGHGLRPHTPSSPLRRGVEPSNPTCPQHPV